VNYIPDIIFVLDWCRWNTGDDHIGQRCTEQILQLQLALATERQWGSIENYHNILQLHSTRVYWIEEQRQITGQVFPFSFWWLRDRDANFHGDNLNPKMSEINDSWNAMNEQVTEKNQPSFIHLAECDTAGRILQNPNQESAG
jgi:hypothetical protein